MLIVCCYIGNLGQSNYDVLCIIIFIMFLIVIWIVVYLNQLIIILLHCNVLNHSYCYTLRKFSRTLQVYSRKVFFTPSFFLWWNRFDDEITTARKTTYIDYTCSFHNENVRKMHEIWNSYQLFKVWNCPLLEQLEVLRAKFITSCREIMFIYSCKMY